jgi:hypothetical protein
MSNRCEAQSGDKAMPNVALYARYSTDNQSVVSIEDQFRICREHAGRERWQVVDTYHDAAISGASVILRPGVQLLLQDAQRGRFDIVLAEALDRVSRDQADVATLFKPGRYAGRASDIAEHYRAKAIRLAETLAEPEANGEAREDIRSLIGEVVIIPGEKRGESHATLRGELMAILDLAAGRRRSPKTEVITNTLAPPRFEPTSRPSRMFCDQTRFRSRRQRTCSPGEIPGRNSIRNQRTAHTRNCRDPRRFCASAGLFLVSLW